MNLIVIAVDCGVDLHAGEIELVLPDQLIGTPVRIACEVVPDGKMNKEDILSSARYVAKKVKSIPLVAYNPNEALDDIMEGYLDGLRALHMKKVRTISLRSAVPKEVTVDTPTNPKEIAA